MTDTYLAASAYDVQTPATCLREISEFVLHGLPLLNARCRDGHVAVHDWLRIVSAVTAPIGSSYAGLDGPAKDRLVKVVGLVACSAERHLQGAGGEPGDGVSALPAVLTTLAAAAADGRWPYPTAYVLWLDDDLSFTFTGANHHRFFRDSVRAQVSSHTAANAVLRDLGDGAYSVGSSQGAVMATMAVAAVAAARRQYQTMKHDLTYMEFNEFRGWLPATSLEGVSYAGPNAAWLHEMMRTDIVLGIADAEYVSDNVMPALPYLTSRGRAVVMRDLGSPSALDAVAAALGLRDAATLGTCAVPLVAELLGNASVTARSTAVSVVEVWRTLVGASAAHVGEIERCLQRPDFTADEVAAMTVKPDRGTGGHAHSATRRIHDMRRSNQAVVTLAAALKVAQ